MTCRWPETCTWLGRCAFAAAPLERKENEQSTTSVRHCDTFSDPAEGATLRPPIGLLPPGICPDLRGERVQGPGVEAGPADDLCEGIKADPQPRPPRQYH